MTEKRKSCFWRGHDWSKWEFDSRAVYAKGGHIGYEVQKRICDNCGKKQLRKTKTIDD